ncbi:MAG: hypothetical protein Q3M24_12380 [Candidatus Electrothrix aestuarii]|uniref:Uncharacterized protein n=1 Tax=Candidatus Electrothrix aestuarii TaxID=3062594 RepID=A0AAU8LNR7_9BACT|nr:hypothetical protein [Candidatus Electrothrix aestuarii]
MGFNTQKTILRPELELDHALKSAALIVNIRAALIGAVKKHQEQCKELTSVIDKTEEIIKHTPDRYVPAAWHLMLAGLRLLSSVITCVHIAQGGEGDLLRERAKYDVLAGELRRIISASSVLVSKNTESFCQSFQGQQLCSSDELLEILLSIPLPTLYWYAKEERLPIPPERPQDTLDPMLRVIIFLDHSPIASPQLLKSHLLYPLEFRVRGLVWPDDAVFLQLDLLTTCPQSEFSVSEFRLDPPGDITNDEYEGELGGQLKFNSEQSSLLDDLVFKVRAAFQLSNASFLEIPVIGHNELRFRVVSENRHPLITGNRRLDRHIEELVTQLLEDCPKVRDELPDLLVMLQALTLLLATYAQEAIYKGRSDVLESEFQVTVLRDLRNILGQDVQEHPKQAGGFPDIRYQGVIVELKVEKANGDREKIAEKYTAQPVQYSGVEARQVSILLVLDVTSKDKPPGDIRNDIILKDVETHGGDDRTKSFPSKVFIFAVNGNMKNPSSYSG